MIRHSKRLGKFHQGNFGFNPLRYYSAESNTHDEVDYYPEEVVDNSYDTKLKEEFQNLYLSGNPPQDRVSGYATKEGTEIYSSRSNVIPKNNFKTPFHSSLKLSSLGIGTYLGESNSHDDLKMFNAVIETVQSNGVNVIDTAINYRGQKSERAIGAALKYLFNHGYHRNELFISSKNGYLPDDDDKHTSSKELIASLISENKIQQEDVVANSHCIHPEFLEAQLEQSLSNLGLKTLDLYYLHNVSESQLLLTGYEEFSKRLLRAFEFCEKKVLEGKIRAYGMATWSSFRSMPNQDLSYVGLQEVVELVQQAAGKKNHFNFIQFPFNFMMGETFMKDWQVYKENNDYFNCTTFEVAEKLKINVMTSVPLSQGLMVQYPLSTYVFKGTSPAVEHLQYIRSTPSPALITTLVGQKMRNHVIDNLEVLKYPLLSREEWFEHRRILREMFE